jgi:glycosyltransferase involved in cell wall biosynthesis
MIAYSERACTVIVPVFEEWHLIPALLASLERQTIGKSAFEVLLVDNGSSEFIHPENATVKFRVLHCSEPGSYAARNRAVEAATTDWLVFTDADCRPEKEWLEELMLAASTSKVGCDVILAGRVKMTSSTSRPMPLEIYDLVRGIPQQWYVSRGYATTANLAVNAETLRRVGGFDPRFFSGGDTDICRRATASGAALEYVEKAVVAHPARRTWDQISRKVRRIKGGQFLRGNKSDRLFVALRTVFPPVPAIARFLLNRDQPLGYRLCAVIIHLRVWMVEIGEIVRLGRRRQTERR